MLAMEIAEDAKRRHAAQYERIRYERLYGDNADLTEDQLYGPRANLTEEQLEELFGRQRRTA